VFCGTDRCKQARARRAAERREAVALLRLVADLAAYGAAQVGNGLTPCRLISTGQIVIGAAAGEPMTVDQGFRCEPASP